jgi:cysteine-rich repeat protein
VWAGNEGCDDGNHDNCDGCRGDCTRVDWVCGDGIVECGEVCDDGNQDTSDDCPDGVGASCQPAYCGDGYIWSGNETCDDGNANNTDACPDGIGGTCEPARCGDNFVRTGVELCDDGNTTDCDGCKGDCIRLDNACGDSITECGEACDDGNNDNTDACPDDPNGSPPGTCQNAVCGDCFIRSGIEQCDDCGTTSGDGCDSSCQLEGSCGDGTVDGSEGCDDGKTALAPRHPCARPSAGTASSSATNSATTTTRRAGTDAVTHV